MSLSFKFIPLTFLNDENEIKKQIRNTIILKYFFERNSEIVHLEDLITGTQYGYNASALVHGRNKFLRISDITDGKVNWETVPYCNCTDEETYLLFPNDILIARTGGTTGKSFLISEPPALSIYAGYLIRIRANEETNPDYLNLFLNSYVYWSQIVSLNEDNFRPSVNANKLKKLVLPKCDTKAQNDAVKISNGELIRGYDELYQLIDKILLKYDKLNEIQFEKRQQFELYNQLKQSIINEAIQGKLTADWREQNANTESASELLKRIKAEKAQLIKDKKIKKEKALPPISEDEIPFELPADWVWCRFGDLVNISSGDGLTSKQMISGDIPVFGGNGINGYHNKYNTSEATVTIGRVGAYCGAVHLTPQYAWVTDNCFRVYFDKKSIFQPYLIWHLKYLNLGKASYDGSQPVISGKRVYPLLTFLPPFEEQKAIVEKIETLMKQCQALEQEIKTADANVQMLIQAILKEAFEVKQDNKNLDSLFEHINYNLYVAMVHKQFENRLKINYGEVATQKTVFNINAFTDQKIPYNFINSNHGTFSPQLKEDLGKNVYLTKGNKGNGEVFIVNPLKEKEVLNALSNPKNKQFVRAVNEVLDIYELPFINKETDKIELLNTVAKLIIDYKTSDLDKIYKGMQDWEIKQIGFKTKAEKFSKKDTEKIIGLIEKLGLLDKLKK